MDIISMMVSLMNELTCRSITSGGYVKGRLMTSPSGETYLYGVTVLYPNGYGADITAGSIIDPYMKWELAVVRQIAGEKFGSWDITYDTPITSDVVHNLDVLEVLEICKDIENLPAI